VTGYRYARIEAEELGVSSANVNEMSESDNLTIKSLRGLEREMGEATGLSNEWPYKLFGSYGEDLHAQCGCRNTLWTLTKSSANNSAPPTHL
jgi:general L-amino acid transport system substrate-binding protein